MNIIQLLKEKNNFSSLERLIADYILDNLDQISAINIRQLADATYCSNGSIIRLCRKLGFSGYKEFKIELIKAIEKKYNTKEQVDLTSPFIGNENPQSIMSTVATIEKTAIDTCFASVNPKLMFQAASWIKAARTVYIVAKSDTMITCQSFQYLLQKIGISCVMVNLYGDGISLMYNANDKDVALFVSYSGETYQKEYQFLRNSKCKCIFITSKQGQSFENNIMINFPAEELEKGKVAGFYSQMAINYLLMCLYSIIFSLELDKLKDQKLQTDIINSIYYKIK